MRHEAEAGGADSLDNRGNQAETPAPTNPKFKASSRMEMQQRGRQRPQTAVPTSFVSDNSFKYILKKFDKELKEVMECDTM